MDGSICRSRSCHLCCTDTAMELTGSDISRLEGAGFKDFTTEGRKLANIDGRCIFLRAEGLCSVYSIRPDGCRSYPLVMKLPERQPMMDRDCPHRASFAPTSEDMIALEDIVRRLEAGH